MRRNPRRAPRRRARRRSGSHRIRVHHAKGRGWFQKRHPLVPAGTQINPRRRRRRGGRRTRRNPGFGGGLSALMPSGASAVKLLKFGGIGLAGFMGVNGVLMLADRCGLAKLKEGKSAGVQAAINAAVRAFVGVPLVTWLGGRVLKSPDQRLALFGGGAFNVVFHGAQDIAAQSKALPTWGASLLLGYDGNRGLYDYMAVPGAQQGAGDYLTSEQLGLLEDSSGGLSADAGESAGLI